MWQLDRRDFWQCVVTAALRLARRMRDHARERLEGPLRRSEERHSEHAQFGHQFGRNVGAFAQRREDHGLAGL